VNFKNVIVLVSLIGTAIGSGACGSSAPSAPTELSGTTTNTTIGNGATINGSITGAALGALSLGGGGFASLAGPGLMVTVVGTSLTTPVNPNGTFVLTNVPPGDIQLRFTGPGTDALLTVTGVTSGAELRITVQVNGNTATLKDMSRKDSTNKVEIEGTVASGACASFVVNGKTITTDAATQFSKGTCASVVAGAMVEVKGSTLPDGTIRASEVKFENEDNEKNNEIEGLVTAGSCGSFTVRNIVVTTNAATVFKNGRCAEIAPGIRVHVRATQTGAGKALALLVNIQRPEIEIEGLVTAGGCGSFTVRGIVVTTNAATQFKDGRCADISVGAQVEVKAIPTGVGTALALVVELDDHDDDEDDNDADDADDRRGGSSGKGKN